MRFENKVVVQEPLEKVWDFLWDYDKLYPCIRGVYQIEVIEPQKKYTAHVMEKVGPFKVNFALSIEVEEVDKFWYIKFKVTGKDSKIAASFSQKSDLRLKRLSDTETELDFTAEVSIFGKLATLGNMIIKKKADEAMSHFVRSIKAELQSYRTEVNSHVREISFTRTGIVKRCSSFIVKIWRKWVHFSWRNRAASSNETRDGKL